MNTLKLESPMVEGSHTRESDALILTAPHVSLG